ncbi:hypothetical protein ACH5RR_036819 [Cinchona calisaya]|uniref:Uncharacterized protein n=1 Tax=Cinchona calisaya TaxID=153742 RepID=A0ABD2Y609_9GENT
MTELGSKPSNELLSNLFVVFLTEDKEIAQNRNSNDVTSPASKIVKEKGQTTTFASVGKSASFSMPLGNWSRLLNLLKLLVLKALSLIKKVEILEHPNPKELPGPMPHLLLFHSSRRSQQSQKIRTTTKRRPSPDLYLRIPSQPPLILERSSLLWSREDQNPQWTKLGDSYNLVDGPPERNKNLDEGELSEVNHQKLGKEHGNR